MNNLDKKTVVILAGGMGTRLGDLTKSAPKALTMVGDKPIVAHAIAWARLFDPTRIIVVSGYLHDQLERAVKDIDATVEVVKNEAYETTARMAGLLCARNMIEGDLIVFDGDYIYHDSIAEKMKPHLRDMTIFASPEQSEFVALDMMVKTENGKLVDMSKELDDYDCFFNSFLYCAKELVLPFFVRADAVIAESGADIVHVEEVLLDMVRTGNEVYVVPISPPLWIEVDNPQELAVAQELMSTNFGLLPNNYTREYIRCALCNSDDYEVVSEVSHQKDGVVKKVRNVVCDRCGLVYNNPMPTDKELDAYYDGGHVQDHAMGDYTYEAHVKRLGPKDKVTKRDATAKLLSEYLHEHDRVLDIGCSYGGTLYKLRETCGIETYGIEPDPLLVEVAQKYFELDNIEQGMFEDFIQRNNTTFHAIVIRHVFEHLKDPNLIIEQMKSLLEPGGFIYMAIPNAFDFLESRTRERALEFGHVYSYTPYTISQLMLKHGLKVVYWSHDYIYHQRLIIRRVEDDVDAIPCEALLAGSDVKRLKLRLRLQNMKHLLYRLRRKINRFLPVSVMSKKWLGYKN